MKGFPSHINDKQDIYNLLPDYPEETKAELQVMLDHVHIWQRGGKLEASEEGIEDDTHRVDAVTESINYGDYDTGNGYSLRTDASAQQLFTQLAVSVDLGLSTGSMATGDQVTFIDSDGKNQVLPASDFKTMLAGYGIFCKSIFDNPTEINRYQSELIEDTWCKLYQLGMTVQEAEEIIGG